MALFQGKTMKQLRAELAAAHTACALAPTLSAEHQSKIATTAPREVAAAAKAASAAGQAADARVLLTERLAHPPTACPTGTSWDQIIQAGLNEL
jgi:uncharacterized lipoprotein YbaY